LIDERERVIVLCQKLVSEPSGFRKHSTMIIVLVRPGIDQDTKSSLPDQMVVVTQEWKIFARGFGPFDQS